MIELKDGQIRVKCGIHNHVFDGQVGKKTGDLEIDLKTLYNIPDDAQIRVNNQIKDRQYVLCDKDTLDFVKPDGDKAMNQPLSNEQANLELKFTQLAREIKTNVNNALASLKQPQAPRRSKRPLYFGILLLSLASSLVWGGARYYKEADFEANFSRYVDAARSTSKPDRAKKYQERANSWLQVSGMTEGRTDVIFDGGPEADIAEWYIDFKDAVTKGDTVPPPPSGTFGGLSLYPYNRQFFLWILMNAAAALFAVCGLILNARTPKEG